jgi:protein-disulfide isomerase
MRTAWTLFFVGIVGVVALIFVLTQQEQKKASTPVFLAEGAVNEKDFILGTASSTVTLVEFSDFECPACAAYFPLVEEVLAHFKGDVAFVYKHFPLTQHKHAKETAYVAEAAGKQGKFFEMYRLLFQGQRDWAGQSSPSPIFDGYAKELGLNMPKFQADKISSEVKSKVESDLSFGRESNVLGTPTFFLEGVKIQNPQSKEAFISLLDEAIQKAKQAEVKN